MILGDDREPSRPRAPTPSGRPRRPGDGPRRPRAGRGAAEERFRNPERDRGVRSAAGGHPRRSPLRSVRAARSGGIRQKPPRALRRAAPGWVERLHGVQVRELHPVRASRIGLSFPLRSGSLVLADLECAKARVEPRRSHNGLELRKRLEAGARRRRRRQLGAGLSPRARGRFPVRAGGSGAVYKLSKASETWLPASTLSASRTIPPTWRAASRPTGPATCTTTRSC
jgi:hypothetical protein